MDLTYNSYYIYNLGDNMTKKLKTSEAQIKASTKWNQKNKEKMNHIRNRSGTKKYISNASLEELEEIEQIIKERKELIRRV